MKIFTYSIILVFAVYLCSCAKENSVPVCVTSDLVSTNNVPCELSYTEMNGVSLENVSYAIDNAHIQPIKDIKATWITTMPFGYVLQNDDSVKFDSDFQWYGETTPGVIEVVELAHANGLKVMVKPHIWAIGTWIGDLSYDTDEEWTTFENSYLKYCVNYARISDSLNVEAFCIGVEMRKLVTERPNYWSTLIDTVRSIYDGPITYASNWDNYQNVQFWNQLDYIGIDAYFPVSEEKTPTVKQCYEGWENDFNEIKLLSQSTSKKVVFTEYGYRNIEYTGQSPWDETTNSTNDTLGQLNAYKALYCRFWGQDWFEGGFLWKWHPDHASSGGLSNNRFTPQNKPVQEYISTIFEETNN